MTDMYNNYMFILKSSDKRVALYLSNQRFVPFTDAFNFSVPESSSEMSTLVPGSCEAVGLSMTESSWLELRELSAPLPVLPRGEEVWRLGERN